MGIYDENLGNGRYNIMKKFNKCISIILSLIIFVSSTVVEYDNAKAATESNSFSATYTGNYTEPGIQ